MATGGVTVDEQFLKDFLAKGGQAATQAGTPVDAGNADAFLKAVNQAAQTPSKDKETEEARKQGNTQAKAATQNEKAAKLHEQAEKQRQKTASEAEKAARVKREAQKREQQQQLDAMNKNITATQAGVNFTRQAVDKALTPAKRVTDRVSSLPTPGGIGLLLLVLAILLFTVVQVNANGDTRMKQIWYMLNGRASVQGRQTLIGSTEPTETIQQELQDVANAEAKLYGDIGNDFVNAVGDVTGVSGFFTGVGNVLGEFRSLI